MAIKLFTKRKNKSIFRSEQKARMISTNDIASRFNNQNNHDSMVQTELDRNSSMARGDVSEVNSSSQSIKESVKGPNLFKYHKEQMEEDTEMQAAF